MVRICVTIRALGKRYARVARLAISTLRVALLALHLGVQSSQWKSCFGMVELADCNRLPIGEIVALGTVCAQPSLVRIFMAGGAGL